LALKRIRLRGSHISRFTLEVAAIGLGGMSTFQIRNSELKPGFGYSPAGEGGRKAMMDEKKERCQKKACKCGEHEQFHEKGQRQSWARNQMGNINRMDVNYEKGKRDRRH
jgi:hypothetical protein